MSQVFSRVVLEKLKEKNQLAILFINDNDEGGLVTYDDYVPLADESPATGMDEITVLTLIGGLVVLLGILSCLAWFKTKFGVPCCSAAKTG